MTAGECKIGIMPGNIFSAAASALSSRSGTLTYEAVFQTTQEGLGQTTRSASAAILSRVWNSSTRSNCSSPIPTRNSIVIIGEIGGQAEEDAAQFLKDEAKKGPRQTHRRLHRRTHGAAGTPNGSCWRHHFRR